MVVRPGQRPVPRRIRRKAGQFVARLREAARTRRGRIDRPGERPLAARHHQGTPTRSQRIESVGQRDRIAVAVRQHQHIRRARLQPLRRERRAVHEPQCATFRTQSCREFGQAVRQPLFLPQPHRRHGGHCPAARHQRNEQQRQHLQARAPLCSDAPCPANTHTCKDKRPASPRQARFVPRTGASDSLAWGRGQISHFSSPYNAEGWSFRHSDFGCLRSLGGQASSLSLNVQAGCLYSQCLR